MLDKIFIKNIAKDEGGSIMVISVMIMSIMSIVTFGLSSIVMKQIDFSRNLDNSVMAYYGAQSSMEQGLYWARKLDEISAQSQGKFENNVLWSRQIIPVKDNMVFPVIRKNNLIEIDLFDPDNMSCDFLDSNLIRCNWESMSLNWQGGGTVQLTLTEVETGDIIQFNIDKTKEIRLISASSPWIINELKSSQNYRIKIKALFDDIKNLKVSLYSEDNLFGNIVPIPNFLTIKGVGHYGNNKQALTVEIPRTTPLSSLFDYVLFSEEDIVKELK